MSESLERFINRRRLFVRVQANVPRELFIQKLNAAFSGARIGVGNANSERGPVTQRVADINYDSAAEATQALRRNRFKLKVGNHDADITYQIERKDVVEKLAGEWGCRFMVVVKNLPPGDISCAELAEMFEAAGEIFTIKILPGNRGEPYALVQYVEEQSVDLSIQQLNQQKMHGAVLYVERHLKARRQGGGNAAPPPAVAPPSSGGAPSQSQATQHTAPQPAAPAPASSGGAQRSAAAVVGQATAAAVPANAPQSPQQQQHLRHQASAAATAATAGTQPPQQQQQPAPTQQQAPQQTVPQQQAQQQAQQAAVQAPSLSQTPTGMGSAPSNSLFSQQYSIAGSTGSESGQYSSASDLLRQYSASSQPQPSSQVVGSNKPPGAPGATPTPLIGSSSAVVGGPSLRAGPPGMTGSTAGQSHVLTPMLDLFSHLRAGADSSASTGGAGGAGAGATGDMHNGLANGGGSSGAGGYAGMLLRGPGAPGNQHPGSAGGLAQLGGPSPNASQSLGEGANSLGSLLGGGGGGAPSPLIQPPSHTSQSGGVSHPSSGSSGLLGQGQGAPGGGANGGMPNGSPAATAAAQQHNAAAAAAAALGLTRISIRDSLRLALGRLEELVTCPLTLEIMRDPVVAADGYTYERSAIQNWLSASDASPMTSESLPHKALVPNKLAREIIADILP